MVLCLFRAMIFFLDDPTTCERPMRREKYGEKFTIETYAFKYFFVSHSQIETVCSKLKFGLIQQKHHKKVLLRIWIFVFFFNIFHFAWSLKRKKNYIKPKLFNSNNNQFYLDGKHVFRLFKKKSPDWAKNEPFWQLNYLIRCILQRAMCSTFGTPFNGMYVFVIKNSPRMASARKTMPEKRTDTHAVCLCNTHHNRDHIVFHWRVDDFWLFTFCAVAGFVHI